MSFTKKRLRDAMESLLKEQGEVFSKKVYRTVRDTFVAKYGEKAIISGVGALKYRSGRWMIKGICYVIYTSANAEIAIREFLSNDSGDVKKLIVAEIAIDLSKILDLTKKETLKKLGLTIDNLINTPYDMEGNNESLTQAIGYILLMN